MLEVEQFENGDFENPAVDGGLAPWVANGLHSFSRESSVVADGQYSLKVTTRDSGSKLGQFISDFEKYRGKTLVLRAMVRRENNALVSISINDGVSETLSSAQSELGRFQIVMLRKKISPAATQLGVFLNVDDANSVAYFDNVRFFEIKVMKKQALDYKIVHHVPEERYIILKRDHRNLTGDLPVGD